MTDALTYEDYFGERKPKRLPRTPVPTGGRRISTVKEWNAAVEAGKVTFMNEQVLRLRQNGYAESSREVKNRMARLKRGYK